MAQYIADKRIWVDDDTFIKLSNLFKVTRGLIPRYELCSAILEEWVNSGGSLKVRNIILDEYSTKNHYIFIPIHEDIWDSFIYCCSNKKLNINIAFRIAVSYFINLIDQETDLMEYFFYYESG